MIIIITSKTVDEDEDEDYTREDVACICDKLYRDELLSVFDADSLEDPKNGPQILNAI
jgi:hypothetical protein